VTDRTKPLKVTGKPNIAAILDRPDMVDVRGNLAAFA
jgi:hypothetical protein